MLQKEICKIFKKKKLKTQKKNYFYIDHNMKELKNNLKKNTDKINMNKNKL